MQPPLVLEPIGGRATNTGFELRIEPVVTGALNVISFESFGGTPTAPTALPAGAAIDPSTGVFTWTPTLDQVGDHQITIRVSDGFFTRRSAVETFTVSVSNRSFSRSENP